MAEDMTRFTKVDDQVDPRIFITFLDAANALEDLQEEGAEYGEQQHAHCAKAPGRRAHAG
jgi:hypothetical protein